MILVFTDDKDQWHVMRTIVKAGIASLLVTSYCDVENERGVRQVPDSFLRAVCPKCRAKLEKLHTMLAPRKQEAIQGRP